MRSFLNYIFKKTIKNMEENLLPNVTTISIIGISLFIFLTFSLVAFNLSSLMNLWEKKFEIVAYLKKETPLNEIEMILKKIRTLSGVETVNYVSPFEAMEFMESRLGHQKGLLEGIKPNIFPASMEIRLEKDYWGRMKLKDVIEELKNIPQIEEIQYGKEWTETFSMVVYLVRLTQLVIGAVLIISIIFIVSNTLQLAISSRKDEIETMYILGASPAFIRIPFYMEGAIQGFLGAVMAEILLFIMYKIILITIEPVRMGWMKEIKIVFFPMERIFWFILGGILIGLIGSLISSIKFLKYIK